MSQKDFVLKKAEIEQKITTLKIKFSEKNGADKAVSKNDGSEFLNGMILFKKMMLDPGRPHDYEDLVKHIGIEALHEITNALISRITVSDGLPIKILFKNGMEHHFTWEENKTVTLVDTLVYQYHEPILKHIEHYGSIDRAELRKLTRCGTTSADRVAYAMIESGALIQIRVQNHIKYAKNEPKS